MTEKTNDVIGLGNLMIDFLVKVEDYKLTQFDLQKGEMHLIDEKKALAILNNIQQEGLKVETAPGGSAANTLRGVGFLGGNAILCGKVGKDTQGDFFIQQIKNHNVSARIDSHEKTTGHSISFITPDSERTMSTCLGAAVELSIGDVSEEDIMNSKILHLEGYQLEGPTRETLLHTIQLAKKHNTLVSIDLADPGLIQRNKDFFEALVFRYIDILFVNETEAKVFTGLEEEEAIRQLSKYVKIAIVKLGEKGALISYDGEIIKIDPHQVNAIDTTGAGDTFAAGFLYGCSQGWKPKKSGDLGSLMASKIVEIVGVKINELNAEEIKNTINKENKETVEDVEEDVKEKDVEEVEEVKEEIEVKNTIEYSQPTIEVSPEENKENFTEEMSEEMSENTESTLEVPQKNKIIKIGIIGGSGLDNPDILQTVQELEMETPYGKPTSSLKIGTIKEIDVVLIARHGREHTIPPTQVNFQANIWALKEQGCTHILATTACGSLREEIKRGDFVILDQFIDFTRHRKITFHETFNPGEMKHTPMATPFSEELRNRLILTAEELELTYHPVGTVVTIEGPRFSTKAESYMYRDWGADVINMSIAPEATLANEIGIPYAAVAMSTDYDCWKEDEKPVTWDEVLQVFKKNVDKVTNLLINTIPKIGQEIDLSKISFNQNNENENNENDYDDYDNYKNKEFSESNTTDYITKLLDAEEEFDLKSSIRTIPDWPKPGIQFRDITTLLENPEAFNEAIRRLYEQYHDKGLTKIAGIDSRGFIFGSPLALDLGLPFVLIRKKGKLPGETVSQEYALEYGTDTIEIHKNSISEGDNVLIVDDLIATGGTAKAACDLVEKLGGNVAGLSFVIDLPDLKGKEKLEGYDVFSLMEFEGD